MLPITVDNRIYITAAEAARRLHISRDTFRRNVSSQLRQYRFGALRSIYYLQSDVDTYSGPQEIEDSHSEDDE